MGNFWAATSARSHHSRFRTLERLIFPSVPAFQPTSIRSVRPAGPVVGRPIRPRRLHAPFHHEPDSGGEILLRSDGKKSQHLHAPRSGPPAATLIGGLRPGSLRVHDPCNMTRTDRASVSQAVASRGGLAAPGNVARDLPVLPQQGRRKIGGDSGDSRRARLPERPGARDRGGWCHRTGKPRNCPPAKDDCPSRSCDRRQDPRAACKWSSRISLDG